MNTLTGSPLDDEDRAAVAAMIGRLAFAHSSLLEVELRAELTEYATQNRRDVLRRIASKLGEACACAPPDADASILLVAARLTALAARHCS